MVEGVTEHLVGERITASLHADEQVVHASHVDAPEDRCVNGAEVIVHAGVQMGCEGEMRLSAVRRRRCRHSG